MPERIPEDTPAGIGNVPVEEGANNVPHIVIRIIVAGAAMHHAHIIEGKNIARCCLKGACLLVGQAYKHGHGLIPGTHLLRGHAEVAVALRNAVVDAHVTTLGIQAVCGSTDNRDKSRPERKRGGWGVDLLDDRRTPYIVKVELLVAANVRPIDGRATEHLKGARLPLPQQIGHMERIAEQIPAAR